MSNNGELVRNALTALFVNRDTSAVERYWSESYLQHNPEMPDARDHLAGIVAALGDDFRYEPGLVVAEGDYVTIHGRYTGWAEKPLLAVDIFRIEDGKIAEHWDVLQEEVPAEATKSGRSMFTGD
ncbi:nuclear transport factor 2 family protein [Streptomyces sp. NPDC048636]|uniref:nuclear transport factor 2 family protein n=1 Tax=Streptomyces sp. NPDC048636 TaxID=3155762 RepID=UPI003434DF4A